MTNQNTGKVALITGGSSGIGEAYAAYFLQTGGSVVIISRNEERLFEAKRRLQETAEIEEKNACGRILCLKADVRDANRAEEVMNEAFSKFGHIDVLINNAAGNFVVKAEELTPNGWNAVIQIVLNGTFFYSSAYARQLIKQSLHGSIVNIVATYAWTGGPGVVHSASAKGGVVAMTKTLAVEWAKYGIRVNAIAPGPIEDTGGADKLWPSEEVFQSLLSSIPAHRLGTKLEVAKAIDWLASDNATYVTGDVLVLDGGRSLGQPMFAT